MTKETLDLKVAEVKESTREALQLVYDSLNQGQQKKLLKDERVKELFIRYNVEFSE